MKNTPRNRCDACDHRGRVRLGVNQEDQVTLPGGYSEKTFSSKEAADMEGIIFARKIIEGEISGLSIENQ